MSELEDHLYHRTAQEILSWTQPETHDIYIIALYIGFVDDDQRQGTLSGPGYNALHHFQEKGNSEDDRWTAYDYQYCARWTLCEPVVEERENEEWADPKGVVLRNKYLADLSLFITDAEYDHFWEHLSPKKGRSGQPGFPIFTLEDTTEYDRFQEKRNRNGEAFVKVCAAVIKRLHNEEIVQEVCGRPVPVVLDVSNDMDDLKVFAWRLTREVNPFGIANDWVETHLNRFGLSE